jgi:hypothetical protein
MGAVAAAAAAAVCQLLLVHVCERGTLLQLPLLELRLWMMLEQNQWLHTPVFSVQLDV